MCQEAPEDDSPMACNLEIYRQKYEQFRHLDRLRWQAPGLVFVSGAALLAVAGNCRWLPPQIPLSFFGLISLLSAYMTYRIALGITFNRNVLAEVAERIGDHDVPPNIAGLGASLIFRCFMIAVGISALAMALAIAWLPGWANN